jgi:outer membrane protein
MKKIALILPVILALTLLATPGTSAELKIGYANLQKALNDCKAGQAAKDSLQNEAKNLEKELDTKQEELKKLKEEIDKKGNVWNKETREGKEKTFRDLSQDFQQQFMDYNERLNKKKQEKEAEIIKELRGIVEELAKKRKYTIVFERSVGGILYATKNNDLTEEVIKLHDKRFGSQ